MLIMYAVQDYKSRKPEEESGFVHKQYNSPFCSKCICPATVAVNEFQDKFLSGKHSLTHHGQPCCEQSYSDRQR